MGLTINAFFLRGIYQDLNDLRVKFAAMVSNAEMKSILLDRIEKIAIDNQKEVSRLRERLQKLEGSQYHMSKTVEALSHSEHD